MKKLTVLATASILLATVTKAQNETTLRRDISNERAVTKVDRKEIRALKGREVSYKSSEQFAKDFNNASVLASERSNTFDEFVFAKDGRTTRAYYDADGELVGTTQMRSYSELPERGQKEIARLYKGYTPGDVVFFDDNEANETDMILYGNEFEDEDSYFAELQKDNKKIVVHVKTDGDVSFFMRLR